MSDGENKASESVPVGVLDPEVPLLPEGESVETGGAVVSQSVEEGGKDPEPVSDQAHPEKEEPKAEKEKPAEKEREALRAPEK